MVERYEGSRVVAHIQLIVGVASLSVTNVGISSCYIGWQRKEWVMKDATGTKKDANYIAVVYIRNPV